LENRPYYLLHLDQTFVIRRTARSNLGDFLSSWKQNDWC